MKNIRNLIINIFCLAGTILFQSLWLPDFFKSMFLNDENWYPSLAFMSAPMPLTIFFILFPFYLFIKSFLQILFKLIRRNIAEINKWDYTNLIISGLILFLTFGSTTTIPKARKLFDERAEANIIKLKPEMDRRKVEELILEANLAIIGIPDKKFVLLDESKDFNLINEALNNLKAGKKLDTYKFMHDNIFNNALFNIDSFKEHSFRRKYSTDMDYQITYSLNIEYNKDNKLKYASYTRSVYMEEDKGCNVLLEIPASKSKTYPFPCPKQK